MCPVFFFFSGYIPYLLRSVEYELEQAKIFIIKEMINKRQCFTEEIVMQSKKIIKSNEW